MRCKEGGEEKKKVGGEEKKRKGEWKSRQRSQTSYYTRVLQHRFTAPAAGLSVLWNRVTLETALIPSRHSSQRKAASHCGNSSPETTTPLPPSAECTPTLRCPPRSPASEEMRGDERRRVNRLFEALIGYNAEGWRRKSREY